MVNVLTIESHHQKRSSAVYKQPTSKPEAPNTPVTNLKWTETGTKLIYHSTHSPSLSLWSVDGGVAGMGTLRRWQADGRPQRWRMIELSTHRRERGQQLVNP